VFSWLGATAFGGPAAHVALMRSELVERRRWVDDTTFLDMVGVTALLPGPNSTELASELGRRRAGLAGLITGGIAFIAPAAAMVTALAWAYTRYGTDQEISDIRYGILPVVAAVVAHAAYKLGRTAIGSPLTAIIGLGATAAFLAGANELAILGAGAAATGVWGNRHHLIAVAPMVVPWAVSALAQPASDGTDVGLPRLFGSFLKTGALLFGSGYVVVAFIEAEFVDRLGVLTTDQVADAIAAGQITPGPLFTAATFVGYLLHGPAGALVATVAIFLPAFVFVALLGRFIAPSLRRPAVRPVLDGLNAASVGLIAGVAVELAGEALHDPLSTIVTLVALTLLVTTNLNPTWLMTGGVLLGIGAALL